jgi:hypothetical protein
VAPGIQSKLARIAGMDRKELRVRLEQELHKRFDLLRHRIGARSREVQLSSDLAAPAGQFFFPAGGAPERANLLRTHLPDETSAILREADDVCQHHFRLLGYENLDYGREIDWHLDRVHNKRAPLDPWFKIPFLDFAVVGDHKVTWELNRHQHLITLAKARLLSGDDNYTRELVTQWRSWTKANPYPLGINWGSSLEVAFRSLSWIWVDQLLAGTAEYQSFRAELLPRLAFHGRYIERYLSTYFSPNTHLLGEAVALFFLGTLYPQMPHASRWKESGWRIVLHEAGRQVRPDGVYFEQSLHYHVYALDFFLHARLLATRNAIEVPPASDAVLARMLEVVAALAQAGPPEGFGDDDGGRLFNPRRNRTEQTKDPLAIGALLYAREYSAARLTEEAIWLFGNPAVEKLPSASDANARANVATSTAFTDGGVYVLADTKPYAQTFVVDAGPQGVGRSGHGHADALSLRLTMDGRRWLVDSGSGVYISKDPSDRNTFRGTGAHNTLRVDGVDQAVPDEPFSWTQIPSPRAEEWVVGKSFSYLVGSHDGYARLADPVVHRRHVLKIAGGPCLVRDLALGQGEHDLELRWHLAPDLDVRNAGTERVDISSADATKSEATLTLIMPAETVWAKSTEVSRTLLSPAYGAYQPAPVVRSQARVSLPAETATALLAHRVTTRQLEYQLASMTQAAVQVYELDNDNEKESQGFFFARSNSAWSFGPWSSDSRLLYCRIQREKLSHLVVIGGTHVAWQGRPLLQASGSVTVFEWHGHDTMMNAESGHFSVTPLFDELTGGVRASSGTAGSSTFAEKR